jgi:SAM-dependent methyltransferase
MAAHRPEDLSRLPEIFRLMVRITRVADSEEIPGVDPRTAAAARVYDVMLGGKDNFAADRELAEQLLANAPISAWIAQQNRAFLGRAVRYCAEQGVRQFLDLGSGLPTQDNVHEVAKRVDDACRVVYVDNDPVAVAHARALLADGAGVTTIQGDVRRPAEIISHRNVERLIDFSQPVVVLMAAILHFIRDTEDPAGMISSLTDVMAPGSYLVLSHATHDTRPEEASRARDIYQRASTPLVTRTRQQIESFFTGLELVEPGLVLTTQWRPQSPIAGAERAGLYAGVARKPED